MLPRITALCLTIALSACANTHTSPEAALPAAVANATEQASPDYKQALVDLNGDGNDDAIVFLQGTGWCGSGGCTMLVLRGEKSGYQLMSRSTVTSTPIRIAQSTDHGWQDLIVHSDGANRLLRFNGSQYPLNPSVQSQPDPAQIESADTVLP